MGRELRARTLETGCLGSRLTLLPPGCVTLTESLHLSGPPFSHLQHQGMVLYNAVWTCDRLVHRRGVTHCTGLFNWRVITTNVRV